MTTAKIYYSSIGVHLVPWKGDSIQMILSNFERTARGKVVLKNGKVFIGKIVDYTTSYDNNDDGAYLTIVPEAGPLKGGYICCYEDEVSHAECLE